MTQMVDKDSGYKNFLKNFIKPEKNIVRIGCINHQAEAVEHAGILTNAEIAAIHEYGTNEIPQRSFLRATLDNNSSKYMKLIASNTIRNFLINNTNKTLSEVGEIALQDVKNTIQKGIDPPLKNREGTALMDSEALYNSLSWDIKKDV